MGACVSAPKECGLEDADKPGATKILVASSIGKEMPVFVLPSDTMRTINRKVEAVHGVQPSVVVRKKYQKPELHAYKNQEWVRIRWDATFSDLRGFARDKLKYTALSDEIAVNFSNQFG